MNRHYLTGFLVTLLMVVFVQSGLAQDQLGIFFDEAGTTSSITTSTAYSQVSAWVQLVDPTSSEAISGYEFRVEVHSDGPDPILVWQLPAQALNAATAPVFVVGMGSPLPIMPRVTLAEVMIVVPEAGQTVWLSVHPLDQPSFFDPPGYGYPVCSPVYLYGSGDSYTPMQPVTQCDSAPVASINPNGEPPQFELSEFPEVLTFSVNKESVASGALVLTNHGSISYSGTATVVGSSPVLLQIDGNYFISGPLDFQVPVGSSIRITPYFDGVDFIDAALQLDICGEIFEIMILGEDDLSRCAWSTDVLDFGEVSAGLYHYLDVELTNVGYNDLVAPYGISEPPFYLTLQNNNANLLERGESCTYQVRFRSTIEGEFYATAEVNGLCSLILTATAVVGPPECTLSVSSIDFVDFHMGEYQASRYFYIRNTGGGILEGSIVLNDTTGAFSLHPGWSTEYSLGYMQYLAVLVYFDPPAVGTYNAELDMGSNCGVLPISGTAISDPAECSMQGSGLVNGVMTMYPIPVGGSRSGYLRIRNIGGDLLEGEVTLDDTSGLFDLPYVTEYSLSHNRSRYISIRYTPVSVGLDTTVLHTGSICGDIMLVGEGLESYSDCRASLYNYGNFDRVAVGDTALTSFYIRNTGYIDLYGDLVVSEGDIEAEYPGPFTLPVGEYRYEYLRFAPQTVGEHFATVTTGLDSCPAYWDISGMAFPAGSDRMGFFADEEGLIDHVDTSFPKVQDTVYLVLKNPSSTGELINWISYQWSNGSAIMLNDWTTSLPGEITGSSYYKYFTADSPIPFTDAMVLAQFTTLIMDPDEYSKLDLSYACYYSNEFGYTRVGIRDPGDLHFNAGKSLLDNLPATPMVTQTDKVVLVQWLRQNTDFEGFNVYRRVDGGTSEKLNEEPVNSLDGLVEFEDTTLAADWFEVYYSVTSITRGKEGLPSRETALELAVEVEDNSVPSRTRLLAIYPNPFNPETNISFELAQPGKVQIRIYDVAGRLVRSLTDGYFEAGKFEETWNGRDDAGRSVPSNVYYARFSTDGAVQMMKMTLLK